MPSHNSVLVCLSHLRWNFVYQRPQHLMSRAARDEAVVYFEEPVYDAVDRPRLDSEQCPQSGVLRAVPVLPHGMRRSTATSWQRALLERLVAGKRVSALWYYTPMALSFSRHIHTPLVVYDCMDELSAFANPPPGLHRKERELLAKSDVVFTGGRSLYEAKRALHDNVHAFPSSIDREHFAAARLPHNDPADQRDLPRPRIGFFGVIDERMDLELVDELARREPGWSFVFIGPVVKIDPASLPRRANISWLGQKAYRELPRYLANWDAAFMPFALNQSTKYISPTKTPEFLAGGVPVVSTAVPDVVSDYGARGLVEIATSAQDAAEKLKLLLSRPRDPWLAEVDRHLASLSWDDTFNRMRAAMARAARRHAPHSTHGAELPSVRERGTHV